MNQTVREIVAQFGATDEAGNIVRVLVVQTFTIVQTVDGRSRKIAGLKEYRSEYGSHLDLRPDGTLYDMRGHRMLRRTS